MRKRALTALALLLLGSCMPPPYYVLHDACTASNPAQPDTCLHAQRHAKTFDIGMKAGTVWDVRLRVRGLFEPTTMSGGSAPDPARPYFYVGGETTTKDYSQWRIHVSSPEQTYTLNHYPAVSHTIYQEDFKIDIPVAGDATVTIEVIDGNDRQIDNGAKGPPDRQQVIKGVTDTPPTGQMVRLDLIRMRPR